MATKTTRARVSRTAQAVSPRSASTVAVRLGALAAARRATSQNAFRATLPFVGRVQLPEPRRLAWYGGIAVLAGLGLMEWPVAIVIAVGHVLSDNHHNKVLEDFGAALEQA